MSDENLLIKCTLCFDKIIKQELIERGEKEKLIRLIQNSYGDKILRSYVGRELVDKVYRDYVEFSHDTTTLKFRYYIIPFKTINLKEYL